MPENYIPLALTEDQCRAVVAACGAVVLNIQENPEMYERVLRDTGKTHLELMSLYTGVIMYVIDKMEGQ